MKISVDSAAVPVAEVAGPGSVGSPPLVPPGASAIGTDTIHVLIGRVLRDLPAVGKGSTAPQGMGGYSFRGIDDTLNALNPILSKHGVFFIPLVEKRRDSDRQTGKGGTLWMVSLRVRYRFYGPAGDYLDAVVEGEGSDSGDKATQKALTAAMKYMLFQVFAISTKEVGEMDAERHNVPDSSPRRQESRKPAAPVQSVDNLSAQFIASARKLGVVIEPEYIAGKSTDELNELWAEIKAGKHTGDVLGAKPAQDAPGAPSGLSPLASLPDDVQTVVRDKRGVFAAGWVAEFMQRKGRLVPTAEDVDEIVRECR
jgi:hypothetical protein